MIFETNEPLHPHLMFPSHFPLTADGISEMDLVGIATIRPSASSHHLQTSSFIRRIPCSFNLLMKIKSILRVKYSLDLNLSRMKMREWWWMSNKRHNRAAKMKEKCQNIYKLSNGAWFCCRFGRLVETLHEWITEESAKNFVVILKFVSLVHKIDDHFDFYESSCKIVFEREKMRFLSQTSLVSSNFSLEFNSIQFHCVILSRTIFSFYVRQKLKLFDVFLSLSSNFSSIVVSWQALVVLKTGSVCIDYWGCS